MKRNVRDRYGSNASGGYTLLWVLMLGVVLVMVASTAIYVAYYGLNHGTRTLQKDTQYGATQGDVASVISEIESYTKNQDVTAKTAEQAATAGENIAEDIQNAGLKVQAQYIGPPFTDSNGDYYVIIQVTQTPQANQVGNPGSAQLRVSLPSGSSGSGGSSTGNPAPPTGAPNPPPSPSQDPGLYIPDGGSTDQNTITGDESGHSGPYIIVNGGDPSSPQQLTVSSGSLTYGADGNMEELETNGMTVQNGASVTVDGSLDTGSGSVILSGSGSQEALSVTGNMTSNSVTLQNSADLTVNGQLTVSQLTVNQGSTVTVNGQLDITGDLQLNSNASVHVGGGSTIVGGLTVDGTLEISGNLSESGSLELNSGENFIVDRSAEVNGSIMVDQNASLTVDQNLCVSGSLDNQNGGKVAVTDQALIVGGYSGNPANFSYGTYVTSGTCPPEDDSTGNNSGGSVTEQ